MCIIISNVKVEIEVFIEIERENWNFYVEGKGRIRRIG